MIKRIPLTLVFILTIFLFFSCETVHYFRRYEYYHPLLNSNVCQFKWQIKNQTLRKIKEYNFYSRLPNDKIYREYTAIDFDKEGTVTHNKYFYLNPNCKTIENLTSNQCKKGIDIGCDLQHIKIDFVYPDKIVVIEQDVNVKKNKLNVFLISENGIEVK
ncbi:MAG: hypothetical protein O9264_05205 [Leptospira sp.]|nr:hypothetical protein [Leptospira sp.]